MYSKGNHKEDGKTTLRMGVIFVNEVIGKGLISKIYNNLMQLHIKKKQKKKTTTASNPIKNGWKT